MKFECPTICLFDVDGTLVTTDGAGREAFERACEKMFGSADGLLDFSFAGLTDPILAERALKGAGRPATPSKIDTLFQHYLDALSETVTTSSGYRTFPGVRELLQRLSPRREVALGLGTGNIEPGARTKLAPADLNRYFDFGGFGSDAKGRAKLLRKGQKRGRQRLEGHISRTIVLGDTPLDIEAARQIGAECIAVATGGYDRAALDEAKPDLLVDNLRDPEVPAYLAGSW